MRLFLFTFPVLLLLVGCNAPSSPANPTDRIVTDVKSLPALEEDALNAVIEIPAGTNHKIEYNYQREEFINDTLAGGVTRIINFLPYPGNYGFVPGTLMDKERGGDGDALDIIVIGESVPTGTLQRVRPIAAMLLMDRGEIDTKIVAIPYDTTLQVMPARDFMSFMLEYDPARAIIESWFLNYKGPGLTQLVRWEDDRYAWSEVRKWRVK
ncbi:MAG: inorganic diphosphatase [Saprospiraceae bacterium]